MRKPGLLPDTWRSRRESGLVPVPAVDARVDALLEPVLPHGLEVKMCVNVCTWATGVA